MRCRICRTQRNLKFASKQLRLLSKRNKSNKLRLPLSAIPQTSGNICLDCDARLQNFHQEDYDGSDVVDVDSNIFHENKKPQVDINVDDDDHDDVDDGDGRRVFEMFYNKTTGKEPLLPLQSLSSNLGSDGDAEVIEVLTSRETTPDITSSFSPSNIHHNVQREVPCPGIPVITNPPAPQVIDVIDLVDYEDTGEERDEQEKVKSPISNKTARSEENETRLMGCLSLISSESESEIQFEACPREEQTKKSQSESESVTELNSKRKNLKTKSPNGMTLTKGIMYDGVECTNNNNLNFESSSIILQHSLPVCGICGISFLDKQSLQDHMQEHEEYNCPACNSRYQLCLDLVYHMRQKHRSYIGNELCEGARCSQDSAMTIRLRFMQRFTFYECQLCGLIDSQFKLHKTHIMQQHADESKSLRDPMMKAQLKCPSCHQNCGTHQIDVCRHLLSKHDSTESSKYINEVEDIESLGLSAKHQRNVQEGARFLTMGTQKQFFIECLLCRRAFSGPNTFSKHLNGHNMDEWKLFRAQNSRSQSGILLSNEIEPPKRQLKRKIETRHTVRTENDSKSLEILSKQEKKTPAKKAKLEHETSLKNGYKTKKIPLPNSKSKTEEPQSRIITNNSNIKTKENSTTTALDNKRLKKLKRKLEKNSQKKGDQSTKGQLRVKVKPPLRHFPTQKYNCKYCQLTCKGFRKLQLHLLNFHRSEEFHSCDNCSSAFITKASLEIHRSQNSCRRKRKWCGTLDQNSNKNQTQTSTKSTSNAELKHYQRGKTLETPSPKWLKEILQLSKERKLPINKTSSTARAENVDELFRSHSSNKFQPARTICRFCSQLFQTSKEFSEHEKTHIAHKDMPWINLEERTYETTSK